MGKVIKHDGTVPSFTIINKRNYSMSYIKDVLEGKDPDLSVLFDIKDGELYRNQDPVWSIYKGKRVTSNGAKVCGVMVTQEGIKEITQESTAPTAPTAATVTTQTTLALEPLVVPEHVKKYIKDRFRIRNREVVYIKGDKPFGAYATIDGMHYSRSYVQQVLEDKNPDISDLFELTPNGIYRSQDPIWGSFKGKPINAAKVCGVSISKDGFQILEVVAPSPTIQDDYYKAIEVPEHIKRLIKYKFKIRNGKVHYQNTLEKQELETYSLIYGHRYAIPYIMSVLLGEKPNLENLFYIKDGIRYRNDDPVWEKYKNTKSAKTFYSICGEKVPVKVSSPSIPRPDDFEWLGDMVVVDTPKAKYSFAIKYKEKTSLVHRVNNMIFTAGFIKRLKEGERPEEAPPIPPYIFKIVNIPGNTPVVMTSDDPIWPGRSKLLEILEDKDYMINGFAYSGEDIIRKVRNTKSCVWDLDTFLEIARNVYPEAEVVANIPLNDREDTGEM